MCRRQLSNGHRAPPPSTTGETLVHGVDPSIPLEDRLTRLQQILIDRATSSSWNSGWEGAGLSRLEYEVLRRDLLANPTLGPFVPRYVEECRDLERFWSFIKAKAPSYEDRRQFIWRSFEPAFARLEGRAVSPADLDVAAALADLSDDAVHEVWQTALRRRNSDPEGAITTARTLLETVCKHILSDLDVAFDEGADLPKLYGLTAQALSLAPDQHTEQIFKQILGGCKTVVEGLGALRNRLSDAHGRSPLRAKPASRHAELAVNLAGATATFLVQTWKSR